MVEVVSRIGSLEVTSFDGDPYLSDPECAMISNGATKARACAIRTMRVKEGGRFCRASVEQTQQVRYAPHDVLSRTASETSMRGLF